jgi:hypothetical protein
MHAAMVMVVALAGLGGDNNCSNLGDGGTAYLVVDSPYMNPYPTFTTPSSYSGYYPRPGSDQFSDDAGQPGVLHSTLWSYFLGHDRGIATAAEIEASVYGDVDGHGPH